jgi:signal transduction histidine kinase
MTTTLAPPVDASGAPGPSGGPGTTGTTGVPDAQRTKPRPHWFAGAASVLVSGLLSITWLVVSITVLVTGLGMIPAALSGLLLLIPWVLVMRWIAGVERLRARAVHGVDTVVPRRKVSTRRGFAGFWHTLGLDLVSWQFWRSVLHHHLVMIVGFFPSLAFWLGIYGSWVLGSWAITGTTVDIGPWKSNPPVLVGGAVLTLVIGIAALAAGVLAERGLARSMLPSTDDQLREEVQELSERRQGAVDAAEAERLRIERDLHDGVQPRLVALAMTLGLARTKIATDPERATELVTEAHGESKAIITDLRQLARGIHPAVLTDRGLDAALSALAARSTVPVDLRVHVPRRLGREQEAVAYFVVSEALTNITRHSGAQRARVTLQLIEGPPPVLTLQVEDDGHGGAAVHRDGRSTGLAGLTDRVRATGGHLQVSSPAGGPTVLEATIPAPVPAPAPAPGPATPAAPTAPTTEETPR